MTVREGHPLHVCGGNLNDILMEKYHVICSSSFRSYSYYSITICCARSIHYIDMVDNMKSYLFASYS